MYEQGNIASVSPHMYTQVEQEVINFCLKVPKHSRKV